MKYTFLNMLLLLGVFTVYSGTGLKDYRRLHGPVSLYDQLVSLNGDFTAAPAFSFNEDNQFSTDELLQDIKRGAALSAWGTVIHLSGFVMSAVFIPMTMAELKYKDSKEFPYAYCYLGLGGVALSLLGPISSCAGASLIEESMETQYERFPRQSYTGYYIKSVAFEAVAWTVNLVGSFIILKNDKSEITPILMDVAFYSLDLGAELFRAKSAIGPLVYAKKAERYIQKQRHKKSLTIHFMPVLPLDGRAGAACKVLF